MASQKLIERTAYPNLPKPLTESDLSRLFSPTRSEIQWAHERTRSHENEVGLLTLLKVFQTLGRFIEPNNIPASIVAHICSCNEGDGTTRLNYASQTLKRHYRLVREYLGVSPWDTSARILVERKVATLSRSRVPPTDLINGAIDVLLQARVELPALGTLRRIVSHVRQRVNDELFSEVASALSDTQKKTLDGLLQVDDSSGTSLFSQLCRPAGRANKKNLKKLIQRHYWLNTLIDPTISLKHISPGKIDQWDDEARRLTAAELARYQISRRHSLILATLFNARGKLLDDFVVMLLRLTGKMEFSARASLDTWMVERRESSEELIEILSEITCAFERSDTPAVFHHDVSNIFINNGGVGALGVRCKQRLEHRTGGWRKFTQPYFRAQRSALFSICEVISFRAHPRKQFVLGALDWILEHRCSRDHWVNSGLTLKGFHRDWRRCIEALGDGQVHERWALEIAVFFELVDGLKSGDIYVPQSHSYDAYDVHLFPIDTDPNALTDYLDERELPDNAGAFTQRLKEWLGQKIGQFEQAVSRYGFVLLDPDGRPIVHRTVGQILSSKTSEIEEKILERLPTRSILDALFNTEHWTQWTRHFGPPARYAPQIDNPAKRYILTSFAYGCGLGPIQAARHFKESIPAHLLSFANRRHIDAETLRAAANDLVNLYSQFELPDYWGSGNSAAADGTLLRTYDDNLFATHHVRYGRKGGIAYQHIADNYVAIFSQFIPCGVREAAHILDGLLENRSEVRPARVHADTHGQSESVFALAYLLGIELFPRIRNWRNLTLYRTERSERSGHTGHLYREAIDWSLIETHWKDYFRVVLAIHSGRISSSWILKRLSTYSRANPLYRAFRELGRVIRTVYLLRWIQDEELRDDVTGGTNKVETYHEFSKHLRFGSAGALRTNDPTEQEKSVIYNQIITNAVMLQTIADQTKAIQQLRKEGESISPSDLARFSPYITRNLKRFGDYEIPKNIDPIPTNRGLN